MQQANAGLARRLQAREAELTASHERLRDIEHRQTLSQERQRLMQDMHDGREKAARSVDCQRGVPGSRASAGTSAPELAVKAAVVLASV